MKKFLLVAFVAITTMVTSCKKDENNSIEGTWQIESATVSGEAEALDECDKKTTIVFTNGTFVSTGYYTASNGECKSEGETKGTYSINGDKITFTGEGDSHTATFNVSGNTLTLTGTVDRGAVLVEVYKRK